MTIDDGDEIARARQATRGNPFLNTHQAAAYLGLSVRKLEYMRTRCVGPRYRLHSRFVRYHIDDLILWSRSTSPELDGNGVAAGPARSARAAHGEAARAGTDRKSEGERGDA